MIHGVFPLVFRLFVIYPTVGHLCDQSSPLVSQHLVSIRLKTELVDLACPFALGGARLPLSYEKCLGERLLLGYKESYGA